MELELRLRLVLELVLLGFEQVVEEFAELPLELVGARKQHQIRVGPRSRLNYWNKLYRRK